MYSIIIPNYGIKGISMLDSLLDSISKFDNPSLDEIIISDDSSSVDTIAGLGILTEKYENIFKIILVHNPDYRSFSKTVNSGMKASNPINDILLLNNDMLALTSFEPFVDFTKETNNNNNDNNTTNNNIGIIGAKLLYPNLSIQHAGIVRTSYLKLFKHIYRNRNYDHPPTNFPNKYIAVTGACQYINRELINKIGYLDEKYILSYEDIDYCVNARLNGYDVWYIPHVAMTHYESATRTNQYDKYNRSLFWNKWNSSYEQIRIAGNISDDDSYMNIVKVSGIAIIGYYLYKKKIK